VRTEVSHIEAAEFDHALREATERERALRWEEVAGIYGHLVERLREASEPQARGMRALALLRHGNALMELRRWDDARTTLDEALHDAKSSGDSAIVAQALWGLGRKAVKGWATGLAAAGALAGYFLGANELVLLAVAGLVVLSGRVRAEMLPENPNARKVEAYYGADPAVLEDCSAVTHVSANSVPTMIAVAEYENPLLDVHCAELFHRLAAAKRRAPRMVWLAGHNHTSIIAHFNTAEERLGREILDFIRLGR